MAGSPEQRRVQHVERERGPKLGLLESGEVVYDRRTSHLSNVPALAQLLPVALSKIESPGRAFIERTVTFEEEIGESVCVPTSPEDEILYAQRPNRAGLTRFVKGRTSTPTENLTVILKKLPTGEYILITAYIGPKSPPEPWDSLADTEADQFWDTHALIWGSTPVIPGTETTTKPLPSL